VEVANLTLFQETKFLQLFYDDVKDAGIRPDVGVLGQFLYDIFYRRGEIYDELLIFWFHEDIFDRYRGDVWGAFLELHGITVVFSL
jgi:hypothetical protein